MSDSALTTQLQVRRGWGWIDPSPLPTLRTLFTYGPGDDRTTGYLFGDGLDWPPPLAAFGDNALDRLEHDLGVRFEIVAFQAYRNGAGCDWHTDTPFDVQAVLSLGATRTFGVRRPGEEPILTPVHDGDLVVMPSGFQAEWQHSVPVEDVMGERVSLVFRTVARG